MLFLLAGCAQDSDNPPVGRREAEIVSPPKAQVADYRTMSCEQVWQLHNTEAMNNALYWLRVMECASRMTPMQARQQTLLVGENDWSGLFRQAILLDNAETTLQERQQIIEQLNRQRLNVPLTLLPLFQVWLDKQNLILTLADERQRFQRAQENSDKQLEAMHEQQTQLQSQLETTTRKLENLTDIERQLSSRKPTQGDLPDGESRRGKSAESETPPAVAKKRNEKRMTTRKSATLLLVDDDPSLLKLLGMRLTSEGFTVITATSGQEALRLLLREKIDLVISDLRMDEMDGLALFAEIQKSQPGMPVIILTAHGSIPEAVAATQQGVFSFLTKPVDRDALYKAIDDALKLSPPTSDESWRAAVVTRSPIMQRLLEQAKMVAQSDVSVLINGQSGTGKEVLAQAIHAASPRAGRPFIAINCGALPEPLLESELFGHARGAFTGAVSQREGLFQAAEGGTLFLDEIGDMPLALQVKLLRVLQERKVRPLGSNRDQDINVRIISATHRDLPKAMEKGEFREDLYYRLNVVNLKLPALNERAEDIPLLANHLLREAATRHKPFVRSFSTDAMKRLMAASWPGNVRQLVNVIEQCVALTSAPVIGDALVEQALEGENTALPTFAEARNQFELNYLRKLLQIAKGNVTQAARMAGRNRTEFYKLLARHELDANDFKE
ncbi:hypothetical protein OS21_02210 [Dickeya oryzae]